MMNFDSQIMKTSRLIIFFLSSCLLASPVDSLNKRQEEFRILMDSKSFFQANKNLDDTFSFIKKHKIDKDNIEIKLLLQKSTVFNFLRESDSAIYYLDIVIKKALKKNEVVYLNKAYTNLGMLLNKTNKYEEALSYFKKNYKHIIQLKDNSKNRRLAIVHFNLGLTYKNLKNFKTANVYLDSCVYYAKPLNFHQIIPDCYGLKGEMLYSQNDPSWEAEINKSINYSITNANIFSELKGYLTLAEFKLEKNDISNSLKCLQKAKPLIVKTDDPFFEIKHLELAIAINKKMGDYKNALSLTDLYISKKSHLDSINNSNEVLFFNEKNQFYEKELRFSELKVSYEKERTLLLTTIYIIVFFIVGVLFLVYLKKKQSYFNTKLFNINKRKILLVGLDSIKEKLLDEPSLYQNIINLLVEEKLYLNSNLTLQDIADKLGTNVRYVSEAVSLNYNSNFNSLINDFRINYAQKIITDKVNLKANFKFDTVAFESGFNSVQSFYRVFKDKTGLTPKMYSDLSKK